MLMFESQRNARGATRWLLLAFAITPIALVLLVNSVLAVAWGSSEGLSGSFGR